ncbi:universal stress protein [Lentilactobacillus laojiaonis]|uniref:universal stress protein n=1 Tax=Lentilactobacillus laojiaonis TaxID=2883998 RepID=UPI001D09DC1A|nr:universal stress protein [Lentilactobacillus laojiaonis]UDM32223.1 universal stress protein [Lentilactobacillus laojiaonis]
MEKQSYQNILVPVDGSSISSKVLDRGIELAIANDTTLDILNVLEVTQFNQSYGSSLNGDVIYKLTEDTEKQLEAMQKRAQEAGVKEVNIHIRFGNPKPIIANEFPQDHQTQLIVLGSTGLSAIERFVVGSVTSFVTRNAICDVLTVRPDKQAD